MKKKKNIIDIIVDIVIILAFILVVYWFIQLLFGGSPTLSEFNMGIIVISISLIVHLYYKFGKFEQFVDGVFPRCEKNIEDSFVKMKEDMRLIKKRLKI